MPDHDHHDHDHAGHDHGPGGPTITRRLPVSTARLHSARRSMPGLSCGGRLQLTAHSVALLADAAHNLGDVLGLLLAWWAAWLGRVSDTQPNLWLWAQLHLPP